TQAVLDRFIQIQPKILIATDGYHYGGKFFDRAGTLKEIVAALPNLEKVVIVSSTGHSQFLFNHVSWHDIKPSQNKIEFVRVPFAHPIWIVFSSGTTGMPKAITHGTGGVLL